jgi:membrane associated rhomboid family serine protease
MLFLYIFGDNVEGAMGHFRFLVFYLACGVAASLVHLITAPSSSVPTVGASGAIAGVLGAYFLLFPRARVVTLVPIFFFFQIVEIPAFIFLGFWFLLQFLSGSAALFSSPDAGGVAWWAHIGGFAAGVGYTLWRFRYLRERWGR